MSLTLCAGLAAPAMAADFSDVPAGRALANGEAITEANVTELLNQAEAKYPTPTDFANGYGGLGSGRTPRNNCIAKVVRNDTADSGLRCSTTSGCGGWAAFAADEVFGQKDVTWKQTTLSNIRPGDLMIDFDENGYLTHVQIYVGPVSGYTVDQKVRVTSASSGKTGTYTANWGNCVTLGSTYNIYTAYPD